MKTKPYFKHICVLLYLICPPLYGADTITLNGLFKNKAVLSVNGKTRVLTIGATSPEGIRLLNIKDDTAILQINGKSKPYRMGDSEAITTQYAVSKHKEVIIAANNRGQFLTVGAINKRPVKLLIDTGATSVALNSTQAKKLGINYKKGQPTVVSTASGMSRAHRVVVDSISIGEITLHNIEAVIIEGNFPIHVLLGMSFLGSIETHRQGNTMTLRKTW